MSARLGEVNHSVSSDVECNSDASSNFNTACNHGAESCESAASNFNTACVILNYNDAERSAALAKHVSNFNSIQAIIIVDNCSTDSSRQKLESLQIPKVNVLFGEKNGGYGAGNNAGIRFAQKIGCKYVVIANPDTEFDEELVVAAINELEADANCAVCSAVQLDIDSNQVAIAAWHLPTAAQCLVASEGIFKRLVPSPAVKQGEIESSDVITVGCVPGAMLVTRVDYFLEAGGYDEAIFLYCEETCLGLRLAKMGYTTKLLTTKHYKHLHKQEESGAASSNLALRRAINLSRRYLLKEYYGVSGATLKIFDILCGLGLFEERLKPRGQKRKA
jgi:N-acetylglucosaminyl-diphospho-decaprenol L-rhamnosyltransferase